MKEIDGIWWFINPKGEKFVSLGDNHFEPHIWLAPYNVDTMINIYGQDVVNEESEFNAKGEGAKKLVDQAVQILKKYNFNTLGMHTHSAIPQKMYADQIYYVAPIRAFPVAIWQINDDFSKFSDVFSTEFERKLESRIKEVTAFNKDQANVLGYGYTDLPYFRFPISREHFRNRMKKEGMDTVNIYPWAQALIQRGAEKPGKQQRIDLLKSNYKNVKKVNEVYKLHASSWNDLLNETDFFKQEKNPVLAKRDFIAFTKSLVPLLQGYSENWPDRTMVVHNPAGGNTGKVEKLCRDDGTIGV